MVTAVILGGVVAWAQNHIPAPTVRIAQEQGTEVFYTWTPASPDFTIDTANSVLPPGFEVTKDGNDVSFHLVAGGPAVHQASITVITESVPGSVANWMGPKVRRTETTNIQWIVYRNSVEPFFSGLGDIVLYPYQPGP